MGEGGGGGAVVGVAAMFDTEGEDDDVEGAAERRKVRIGRARARGEEAVRKERWEDALASVREAVAWWETGEDRNAREGAEMFTTLAKVLLVLEQPFGAIQYAEAAVKADSTWAQGLATLARAQASFGEIALALATARRALEAATEDEALCTRVRDWMVEWEALDAGDGRIAVLSSDGSRLLNFGTPSVARHAAHLLRGVEEEG
jgi:hypothetical protein